MKSTIYFPLSFFHQIAEAQVMKNVMTGSSDSIISKSKILAECQAKDTIQNALLGTVILFNIFNKFIFTN